jgi:hypothetical protein
MISPKTGHLLDSLLYFFHQVAFQYRATEGPEWKSPEKKSSRASSFWS